MEIFPVHDNLESALEATKDSLSFRMGVVHRGLEAKGLDANPFVVQKLQSSNHSIKNLLMEYLEIILNDEIKHVKKEILGGNLQIKTGMILLSFAKRLNNSLLREKNLTFKQESKLASLKKNAKSLKNFTLDFLS